PRLRHRRQRPARAPSAPGKCGPLPTVTETRGVHTPTRWRAGRTDRLRKGGVANALPPDLETWGDAPRLRHRRQRPARAPTAPGKCGPLPTVTETRGVHTPTRWRAGRTELVSCRGVGRGPGGRIHAAIKFGPR